jgi:DNA-directed RNA polymerase subunit RPC12/RpoP
MDEFKAEMTSDEPVVHAHWVTPYANKRTGKAYTFVCSNCEKAVFTPRQLSIEELGYAFCPHCGAKME